MAIKKYKKSRPFSRTISIVCGGSKGIGKAIARSLVQYGGSVLIIARNKENLKQAAVEIDQFKQEKEQFVEILACDTSDMEKLKPLLAEFINKYKTPDYLINNVGYSQPNYIEKIALADFKKNMEVNFYGQLVPTLILLPYFINKKKGYIINVSSVLGYLGIMGYASYCPTKFAIVGFSEVLRHELKPYNINVSLLYPPDTKTPGYEQENRYKPKECALISEHGSLLTAEKIADCLIKGILKKRFKILPGPASFLWKMYRHWPWLVRRVADNDYKKARKKLINR